MKPLLPISTGNVGSQEAMGFAKHSDKKRSKAAFEAGADLTRTRIVYVESLYT